MPEIMDDAARAITEARQFIEERAPQLVTREELDRMVSDLTPRLAVQRPPIFGRSNVPEVRGGRYDGLTHFDLSIVKALREASELGKGRAVFDLDATRMMLGSSPINNRTIPNDPDWEGLKRALDSTTSAKGGENVPTLERAEAWRDVHLATVISGFLPRINMPSNPFDIPLELGDITFYKAAAENTTVDESDPATAKNTLTAGGVKAMSTWSYELDEDSIIAMLPSVREVFVRNTAETIDDLLLQADATAANSIAADGAALAASSRYLYGGGDGLLHLPLVDNTGQGTDHNAAHQRRHVPEHHEEDGEVRPEPRRREQRPVGRHGIHQRPPDMAPGPRPSRGDHRRQVRPPGHRQERPAREHLRSPVACQRPDGGGRHRRQGDLRRECTDTRFPR